MKSKLSVGIIWNKGYKLYKEILEDINIMQEVVIARSYNLSSEYEQFILDCYLGDEEAYQDGYIYDKIRSMSDEKLREIIVFAIKIENPTYKFNLENNNIQCEQTREIKKYIRNKYSLQIDGYFFDNLIHISDNDEETLKMLEVICKKREYVKNECINIKLKENKSKDREGELR